MASDFISAPAAAAQQPISAAQLLDAIEHLRKGTICLLVVAADENLDACIGTSLAFLAECQERELDAIAAGIRALCPAQIC
jgi:hypothetical protein